MSFPENSQSVIDANELLNDSVTPTAAGESGPAAGLLDDEPTCMHTVVAVSLHACHSGSQYPEWMLGSFSRVGSSLKQTARTPRSALRCTSCAASSGSHSGMMQRGMLAPFDGPHHSSTIQSL